MFDLTNASETFIIIVMRSFWRTLGRATVRDIALVCAAVTLVGVSYGATAVTDPIWQAACSIAATADDARQAQDVTVAAMS